MRQSEAGVRRSALRGCLAAALAASKSVWEEPE